MDCHQIKIYLSPYLDSELDPRTTMDIAHHLENCEGCNRRYERERTIDDLFRDTFSGPSMPDEVWAKLAGSIGHAHPGRFRRRLVVSAAAAAVLLACAYFFTAIGLSEGAPGIRGMIALAHFESWKSPLSRPDGIALVTDQRTEVEDFLSRKLRSRVEIPEIPEKSGHRFELYGAKILPTGSLAMGLVYYRCCGEPVSVFLVGKKSLLSIEQGERPGQASSFSVSLEVGRTHHYLLLNKNVFLWGVTAHAELALRHLVQSFAR